MTKLYKYFGAALAVAAAGFTADAMTVNVDIDNPAHVLLEINSENVEVIAGVNTFEIDSTWATITLIPAEGCIMTQLWANGSLDGQYVSEPYYFYPYGEDVTCDYKVETALLADLQTGTFTVNVDDPDKVNVVLQGTYVTLSGLQAGANTVKYIPDVDTAVEVGPATYGDALYSVTMNGTALTASWGSYTCVIEEGMELDIKANFPDEDCAVKFSYEGDGEGFVTKVVVNDGKEGSYELTDFAQGSTATVKCGDTLTIYGDENNYRFYWLKVNDTQYDYFYNSQTFTVTGETDVTLYADKFKDITIYVDIDNPDRITLYKGYSYYNDTISLEAGTNEVVISNSVSLLQVQATSGNYIVSVTANGEPLTEGYSGYNIEQLTDGLIVKIETGEIQRDNLLVVYIDEVPAESWALNFMNYKRDKFTLENGYNEIRYAEDEVPFMVGIYNSNVGLAYLNGKQLDPQYAGSTSYQVDITETNSVLKLFTLAEPTPYSVTFTVSDDVKDSFSAVHDLVQGFDPADGLQAFAGTMVTLRPAAEADLMVTVNGDAIEIDGEAFTFTVEGDTEVSVSPADESGIDGIGTESGLHTVYNLQGIAVMRNASAASLRSLPAGTYIVDGKKIRK